MAHPPSPISSDAQSALWDSMHPSVKMDCIIDLLSDKRTALFRELHTVEASFDPCKHQIAYIKAQINALDDIQDGLEVADVDRVYLWLFPLAKAANLASQRG